VVGPEVSEDSGRKEKADQIKVLLLKASLHL